MQVVVSRWTNDDIIPELLPRLSALKGFFRMERGSEGVTYHQPIFLIGGQVVVCEQPGGLQDSYDALHVARQSEAVMGQDQQLCGWLSGALVRQDCEPWPPTV